MNSLGAALMILALAAEPAASGEKATPIGNKVVDFTLQDYLGTKHSLADWSPSQAVVVAFLGTECPLAKMYAPRLVQLAAEYGPKGVTVVGIDSNRQDSLADLAQYAKVHKIEFPLLKDPGNVVADQFGAVRTPEVFVLDKQRSVRYWGRIDDQYGVGYARSKATQNHLAAALDQVLADQPVSVPVTEAVGCHIGRMSRKPASGEITYSKHIAPILQARCVECHRPGQIAPFAMESYQEVVGWAETIREVVDAGRMPPWHANPDHGRFLNNARLADAEKQLDQRWIDGGLPEGNPADLPPAAKFVDGWRIPQPDVVFRMPTPIKVPPRGTVQYKYVTFDPGFTEDKWLAAAEARPGNWAITHHIVLFYHPPGKDEIGPEEALFNSLAAFAPGMPAAVYPDGMGRRIPAGSKLIFQLHYTPNGSLQQDQSEVGLVFADPKTVKKEIGIEALLNWEFKIPPGEANHRVQGKHRLDQDMIVYSLTPHMHLRGKAFRFEAEYPNGQREVLLDVPRYDFNWQNFYILAEPKRMPRGTLIHGSAVFDNSADNPSNPDPNSPVFFGEQTWEEMMVGTLAVSLEEQDLAQKPPQITPLDDGQYEVLFTHRPSPPVEAVYLAGSFNKWQAMEHKMDGPDEQGRYTTRLVLKKGPHEYKFVLNGKDWQADPNNGIRTGFYRNSLVCVGTAEEKPAAGGQ